MDQRGYQDAAGVLPLRLRREAMALPERQVLAEELRLRVGQAMTVLLPEGSPLRRHRGSRRTWRAFAISPRISPLAAAESLRRAISASGRMPGGPLAAPSARRLRGSRTSPPPRSASPGEEGNQGTAGSRPLPGKAFRSHCCSRPGGKTTLLRDLIRCLSDGVGCHRTRWPSPTRQGEGTVSRQGPGTDGPGPARTDILDGCPQARPSHAAALRQTTGHRRG